MAGRERKGSIRERGKDIYARITWVDAAGKRRETERKAANKTEARRLIKQMLAELETVGETALDGEKMIFRQLADEYAKRKIFPAEYHDTRKIAGLKSWHNPKRFLQTLAAHFGNQRIRTITHDDLAQFKRHRLQTPKADGTPRRLASVNRELELMRAVLRFAEQQGWLLVSPFQRGAALISKSDETQRNRVLTFAEERRLLAACTEPRTITYQRQGKTVTAHLKQGREHLRALIITALDTAMRRGELFTLCWHDVDLTGGLIRIRAHNTKTQTERIVGVTPRVGEELTRLWDLSPHDPQGLIFGISSTIKKSFGAACQDAGIDGLRFHDLRHTAITRMVNEGLPSAEIMKTSGHTQMTTFQRYVNPTAETARRNAERLATYHAARMAQDETLNSNDLIN